MSSDNAEKIFDEIKNELRKIRECLQNIYELEKYKHSWTATSKREGEFDQEFKEMSDRIGE